ncbi:Uncharacterised protein [Mycobacteroides abscessus subsp. abscessus]|nr:Uncharacterised protein [Mycobacteroides abscessus subsp. abscessus]
MAACLRSATDTAPKSALVAPYSCMYRRAIIATDAAGVLSPWGYDQLYSTPRESAVELRPVIT